MDKEYRQTAEQRHFSIILPVQWTLQKNTLNIEIMLINDSLIKNDFISIRQLINPLPHIDAF